MKAGTVRYRKWWGDCGNHVLLLYFIKTAVVMIAEAWRVAGKPFKDSPYNN